MSIEKLEAAALAATPTAEQSEREAFEEWFEADAMPAESDWFKQDSDGDYVLPFVQHAWVGWQARAALAKQPESLNRTADKAWSAYMQMAEKDVALKSISAHQLRAAIGVTMEAATSDPATGGTVEHPIDLQRPLRPKDMTEAKRMIVQLQGRLEELKAQQTGEAVIDSDPFPPQETTPVTIEEAVRRANATLTSFEVVTEKPKTTFPPDWEE